MARIVFNSELEKQWWKEIVDKLHMGDDIEEAIERFNAWAETDSPEDIIDAGKSEFWRKFFYQSYEYVEQTTPPIMIEDYMITGTCIDCGGRFEGLEDGELTAEEYVRLTGDNQPSLCSICYDKQETEDGSHVG